MSGEAGEDELLVGVIDGVATLVLNRPERHNALSWTLVRSVRAALADLKGRDDVRVVVLTGAGDRAFCAGADLTGMAPRPSGEREARPSGGEREAATGHLALHESRGDLAELFQELWALGKPTIAKVRGYALAGGMGLALACDLVVAADDATFGTPEIDVGLWPFMITVPMMRSMPPKRALELMMTGRRVDAAEAERIGFVTEVTAPDALDPTVDALAATLAAKPPGVMRLGRDAFYAVWDQGAAEALRALHPLLTVVAATEDAAEGIAAFREKRPPRWSGR
jgi:enoyl-CoA hydratase/carnithine racemase